jgi:quinol monooxygenase YgiN
MRCLLYLLLTTLTLPSSFGTLFATQGSGDTAAYAVSYVEVMPSSKATAVAAFKQYREMSRKDAGYVRIEVFEQIGRPGHFAVLETWTDQNALDAHGMAGHTKELLSKLQPIRVGEYDQRAYKALIAGAAPAAANGRAIHVLTHVDTAGPKFDVPALFKQLVEASRKEQGSLRFDVLQNAMRMNHFTIVETWDSENAFEAHAASAHARQFRGTIQPALGSPFDQRLYKIVD